MTSDNLERRKAVALERLAAVAEEENLREWKKEKITYSDANNYKERGSFFEFFSIMIVGIGFWLMATKIWYLGLIFIIGGSIWTYKNYKRGRERVINARRYLRSQVGKPREEVYENK
ncbi:hypothetical protein J4206_00650 [Candidatus Woesearchaeota archaeon]|nr:hypothetical protein [Candidatus Woesearchaeota archaeon]